MYRRVRLYQIYPYDHRVAHGLVRRARAPNRRGFGHILQELTGSGYPGWSFAKFSDGHETLSINLRNAKSQFFDALGH